MRTAFDINRLSTSKFPLSYAYSKTRHYISLGICPVGLIEIINIIKKYALNYLIVFDVDHYSCYNNSGNIMPISEMADENGIKYHKYDNDNIVIHKNDLMKFLDFSHHNFKIIDRNIIPNENEFLEMLNNIENKTGNNLEKSKIFISIHDDCYLSTLSKSKKYITEIQSYVIKSLIRSNVNYSIDDIILDDTIKKLIKKEYNITIKNDVLINEDNNLLFPVFSNAILWKKASSSERKNEFIGNLYYKSKENIVMFKIE